MSFTIGNKTFEAPVVAGSAVIKCNNDFIYVCKSEDIARTLTEWECSFNLNSFLLKNLPYRVEEIYSYKLDRHPAFANRESRVVLQKCSQAHHESIWRNLVQKHGFDKVVSSEHLNLLFESPSSKKLVWQQAQLVDFDFKKIFKEQRKTRKIKDVVKEGLDNEEK